MSNIHQSCVLIRLKLKAGRQSVEHDEATTELAIDKEADKEATSVRVKFFGESMKPLKKQYSKWRRDIAAISLAWDDGQRLLPARRVEEAEAICRSHAAICEGIASQFCREFQAIRSADQTRLGQLFKEEDYPSLDEMRDAIAFESTILPLPRGDHLPSILGEEIRGQADAMVNAAIDASRRELRTRIIERVTRFVERVTQPDAKVTEGLIKSVKDITNLIPDLNIANDEELTALHAELQERLKQWKPDLLNAEDKSARTQATEAGRAILQKYGRRILASAQAPAASAEGNPASGPGTDQASNNQAAAPVTSAQAA